MHKNRMIGLVGALALAVPGVALANPGHGQGKGQAKAETNRSSTKTPPAHGRGRNVVLKGTVLSTDTTANTVTIHVTGGNRFARAFKGQDVTVSVAQRHIFAADTNGNGTPNELADVRANDKVLVHVHLTRGQTANFSSGAPLVARQLVDQTTTAP